MPLLNNKDTAIILAALNLLHETPSALYRVDLSRVATNDGEFHLPTKDEINALCQRLNFDDDKVLASYSKLHDMVSDHIESAALKRVLDPKDYRALVEQMVQCAALNPEKP